jgi:signal transduction histidine kinase
VTSRTGGVHHKARTAVVGLAVTGVEPLTNIDWTLLVGHPTTALSADAGNPRFEALNEYIGIVGNVVADQLFYSSIQTMNTKVRVAEVIAHEVDAPAGAIRAAVEAARRGQPGAQAAPVGDALDRIDLLSRILLARAQTAKLAITPPKAALNTKKYVSLRERGIVPAKDCIAAQWIMRHPNGEARIDVRLDGLPDLVRFTEEHLFVVFFNLFANALKYVRKGCDVLRVEVAGTHSRREGLTVHVRDFGLGIPEGEESRITRLGERGSNTVNIPGAGIGLGVAGNLLAAHGCGLRVGKRENPTTILVTFPNDRISCSVSGRG